MILWSQLKTLENKLFAKGANMKKIFLVILLCLPLLSAYSQKKEVLFPAASPVISFSHLSDWISVDAGDKYYIFRKDTSVVVIFRKMSEANNLDEAAKIINKEEEKDSKVELNGDDNDFESNGIKFYQRNEIETRKKDGKQMSMIITYFVPDGKTKMVVIIGATEEGDEKHSDSVVELVSSIKPVKK
jgi:hypothetical protein